LISINRPDARNAVNPAVAAQLGVIVADTEADADIQAVILIGTGKVEFCRGADLQEVSDGGKSKLYNTQFA
jgi:enoyl-CoA hydratase/carnithine racemase